MIEQNVHYHEISFTALGMICTMGT